MAEDEKKLWPVPAIPAEFKPLRRCSGCGIELGSVMFYACTRGPGCPAGLGSKVVCAS